MREFISQDVIEQFLNGSDPEQYIIGVEYDHSTNTIFKTIQDPEKGKLVKRDSFQPFLWVGDLTDINFYEKSKSRQRDKMSEHGIRIQKLRTDDNIRLSMGHTYLVKSTMNYQHLISFFKQGGIDPWSDKFKSLFTILTPSEQYLIQKGKRLFKGFENYEDIHRLMFDIETTGLDPSTDKIILIGIKTNRGFKKVIDSFGEDGEKNCIIEFFRCIGELNPSIIGGHNIFAFDLPFIMSRAESLGVDVSICTQFYTKDGIKVKEGVLKLANEVEPYQQYMLFGFNIIDTSHSVRRAQAINSEIKSWGLKYITQYLEKEKPNRVYVDGAYISKIYLENKDYYINPKTGKYKEIGEAGTENLMVKYPNRYEIWNGKKIIEQYLDDDLYETMVVDDSFSQSTFLLSKLIPTTYERISTMGTATLWKIIMLEWSYNNNLAIPMKDSKRAFTGGLSRLINAGFAKDVVKFDFSSLYPSIGLVYDVFPECDVTGVQKSMLKYFRDLRISYKRLAEDYKETDSILSEKYDRKQLPIKIFINSYFGSLSAPQIFPWGDVNKGETITCIGRQMLRLMIMFFTERGYKPLVMDTDGVNFQSPENVNDRTYVGKGLNELVSCDKVYTGVYSDVAEFNDLFMRNEMGLDIDYFSPACINLSRKNYIIKQVKKGKTKIKLTGNSIKSKKMPQYISEFLDESLTFLLNGDGSSFINLYYSYVSKIYNKEIPLAKIANKSRVKQSVNDYLQYIKKKTKSGSLMSRQAHMELLVNSGYQATLGETIYYINNGSKKTDGDVQKITSPTKRQKEDYFEKFGVQMPQNYVQINCYMISDKEILNNPDMKGDYNVPRYLSIFNKKIEPLLVVFKPEIRNEILIDDPKNRGYFTTSQCELDNGHPLKESGQDDIHDVLSLSESEVLFWNRIQKDPYSMFGDEISLINQYWVNLNREIVSFKSSGVKDDSDDVLEINANDYAYHSSIDPMN